MVKKEKKISINALEKIAKEEFPVSTTQQWFGVEVLITRTLPLTEMLQFAGEIVDACFLEDGTFMPEAMDFAIKSGVLTHYANFTLPQNIEKRYDLIYRTGAADMVCQHIDAAQLQEIINAANRKIKHLCDASAMYAQEKLKELTDAFCAIQAQLTSVLGGVSEEDMQAVISAVEQDGISESKIVSAYLDRMKADAESTAE